MRALPKADPFAIARLHFCLFHAGDTRFRVELETQLGSHYQGVLSSDDYSVYSRSVLDFFEQALMAQSGSLPEPPSLVPVFDT